MSSERTKRIAKNTLLLYVRMLFGMLVSLYTSRVVLNTLGVEDYGIYNVVGGFVTMFSLISASLSSATSRFLTFELGRDDADRLKKVFSTSLAIHVTLGLIVIVLAETVGVWFVNTQMTIPDARLYAANWVFQASVLSFVLSLLSTPYNAAIVSHEKMTAYAYMGILSIMLNLCIVLFIAYAPWTFDRLIVYACLLVGINVICQCTYVVYCRRRFAECASRIGFERSCWKELSSFAGWNFIGCTAGLLSTQGVNILLNLFFGPVVNAARGIATSVNTAVVQFSGNFMMALNPQITKSYAAGERDYMFSIVERGSRFSFYIILFLAMPILFETDFILTKWLKIYPPHTVYFVRLVLLQSLTDILSNTLITLQSATGKIRNYQLAVGGTMLLILPTSYICLKLGATPESVYIVAVAFSLLGLFLRLLFLRGMVGLSMRRFVKNVCFNVAIVALLAALVPFLVYRIVPEGWIGFLSFSVLCLVSTGLSILYVGCTGNERQFILSKVKSKLKRFSHD